MPRPLALIILDGWGYREDKTDNAIASAAKPNWDKLWKTCPHTLLDASGLSVGLPPGQMGNSEVGHLTIGAGRVIHQDLTRIDLGIQDRSFFSNPVLIEGIQRAISTDKAIHIIGLLSPGGVHSHENHIKACITLAAAQAAHRVYIHAFLDGRDTPPRSAASSLSTLMEHCSQHQCGEIASLIGRYYAMDRDNRWDRVQQAYDLLTLGKASFHAPDPLQGLQLAYDRGENDEFVQATTIARHTIQDGDTVIFMNFRADRAREMTHALVDTDFKPFVRDKHPTTHFIGLTEYDPSLSIPTAFRSEPLTNMLGDYLSQKNLNQLRIAETEKYAHVTFFFNGGIETPYPHEDRALIPSKRVATYDLEPEMSAFGITERLIAEIKNQRYDFLVCNFANPDMVGHTGMLPAAILAIETIDACLGKIIDALHTVGGEALITADHGNAEHMFDEKTHQPHTAHTLEPVPLVYTDPSYSFTKERGALSDIAPTLLHLLDIPPPSEMTGQNLLTP